MIAVAVGFIAALGVSGPAAASDPTAEAQFLELINRDRATAGVGGVSVSDDLAQLARDHAAEMASHEDVYHVRDLGTRVSNWEVVGDNVGRGTSVDEVHGIFMSSDAHRHNIVDGRFTEIGIGVEWRDGTLYVTQIFRDPTDGTATTTTTTTTSPPRPRRTSTASSPTTTAPPSTTTSGAPAQAEGPPPTTAPTTTAVPPAVPSTPATTNAPSPTVAEHAALLVTPSSTAATAPSGRRLLDDVEHAALLGGTSTPAAGVDSTNAILAATAGVLAVFALVVAHWSARVVKRHEP